MEKNNSRQIAGHFRGVYFGGNWTVSSLEEQLAGITWQEATTKLYTFNTIATLVFHISYFISTAIKMLESGVVEGNDKLSFAHPPINCEENWKVFTEQVFNDGRKFCRLIEQIPEEKLWQVFGEEKYGNYYRNLHGIIEHTHYHLGQIVIIKKMVRGHYKDEQVQNPSH